jgi:hypothetical protein
MRPLKARVIVELRKRRQAQGSPMLHQSFPRHRGGNGGAWPRSDPAPCIETALSTATSEPPLMTSPLDDVELVPFGPPRGDLRQVPSHRGRLPPHPMSGVEDATTFQHASNGAQRGRGSHATREQLVANSRSSKLPEVAMVPQLSPNLPYGILQVWTHKVGHPLRRGGTVAQLSAVETLATNSLDPALYGGRAHVKLACHRAQRSTTPNGSDHALTPPGTRMFFVMISFSMSRFSPGYCPDGVDT